MADSDNSTTLPSVTNGEGGRSAVGKSNFFGGTDPALALLRDWARTQHVSQVLCRLQQRLERRVLGAEHPDAMDEKVEYSIAYQAEVEAATATLKLQDKVPNTPAQSLLGIVAKLEIIVGSDRDIDDPTDFPWPHIASVLEDLRKIAGSVPLNRADRSAIQSDCRRYQAIAADLLNLERQPGNSSSGPQQAFGVNS